MSNSVFYALVMCAFVAVVAVSVSWLGWYGIILDCCLMAGLYDGATHYASQEDSREDSRNA